DEVGLAEVAPVEPARPLHLADPERRCDSHEDERGEHVDEQGIPALALEPSQRGARGKRVLAVDDRGDRDEDRGEENDEAPEDEGVHEAGAEPLEELPLAKDDARLVPDAGRQVRRPAHRLARAHEPCEKERPPDEEPPGERDRRDERDRRRGTRRRAQGSAFWVWAFRSSAEIAGTTSCRSPITA